MQSPQAFTPSELQQFIEQPQQLLNQPVDYQLTVANYREAPRQLLEVLANSPYPEVAQAASMHVNLAGEAGEDWQEIAEAAMKTAPLGQNDRLVAELLRLAPVPEVLVSEWMPGHRLIEGIENPYMPQRYRIKLLERLALSPIIQERLKAAAHPDTPYSTLEQLAGDLELPIRIAVKYHANSPTQLIEQIEAQHEIAQNWETNPEELTVLGDSPWSWIRLAVARNPYTPHKTLAKLAQDSEEKIQLAIARNLFTPAEVLDLLVNHYYQKVTEAIAKHPNASEQALKKLLPKHKLYIHERCNFSGKLPKDIQFIKNPNTPSFVLEQINIEACPWQWRVKLAQHPNTSADILETLSQDSCPLVRLSVFQNINISKNLANNLLKYFQNFIDNGINCKYEIIVITGKDIKLGLASSKNTPVALLEKIGNDLSCFATLAIALIGNPNTPIKLINKLTQKLITLSDVDKVYSDWEVYYTLSFNLSISEHKRNEYFKLFQQSILNNISGCRTLSKLPNTPSHVLELLATTDAVDGVAENPNTPPHVLRQLAKHISPYVREYVAKNPSTPADALIEIINQPNLNLGHYEFNTYSDYIKFAYEYPNIPKIELYRILLVKEAEEEAREYNIFEFFNIRSDTLTESNFATLKNSKKARCRFAKYCDTPVNILEELAKDSDIEVRTEVSKNPNLPLNSLIELAKDPVMNIRLNIASHNIHEKNKITFVEVIAILAMDEALEVREKVASNPNTPINILRQLARDNSREVRSQLVKNSNTPPDIIEYLWQEYKLFDPNNYNTPSHIVAEVISQTDNIEKLTNIIASNFISHSQVPAFSLEKLAIHQSNLIRANVAKHPNTPIYILEKLIHDSYCGTHYSLATNLNTPPYLLEELLIKWEQDSNGKYNYGLCLNLAQRKNVPHSVLERLASSEQYNIRLAVARNATTPIHVLKKLANRGLPQQSITSEGDGFGAFNYYTSDEYLLHALAHNPSLNPEILELIANDPNPEIRSYIIGHPNLTIELWQKLAKDDSPKVRKTIACLRKSPRQVLELLASDKDQEVLQYLASNPSTPVNVLETLAFDTSCDVLKAVAANKNTSIKLLGKLAQYENKQISEALIQNPNTPAKLRQALQYKLRVNISPTLRGLNSADTDDLTVFLSEYVESFIPFVRFVALMHPLTPVELLQEASQSLFWQERYAVAVNPAAPAPYRSNAPAGSVPPLTSTTPTVTP